MSKKPTLGDVAKQAGVSTATVARVLHNRGYVAEETREAVEHAIAATGYRLNILAQSLRRQRTQVIGHVLFAIFPNPFYAQVALGVEQEALKHGYSILAYNVQGDAERERIGVETLIQRQVDAILFTTPASSANVQLALDAGVPVVQVERPTGISTSCVWVDNYVGAVAAMEHLIELGHERIAFIGSNCTPDPTRASRIVEEQRLQGYLDTMRQHGLPVQEEWIAIGHYYSLENSMRPGDGYLYTNQFLDAEPRPTAIFATCDFLATGAYQSIYEHGLRVPDDISVVGFDDTLAPYLTPPLTTVAQPMLEIGRAAAQLAIEQLNAPDHQDSNYQESKERVRHLSTRFVARASTGPVNRTPAKRRAPKRRSHPISHTN